MRGTARCCGRPQRGLPTPYALFSRNRLLGHTALEYHTHSAFFKMGAFEPTPLGETLADVLTGPGRAFRDVARRRRTLTQADGSSPPAREADFAEVAVAQSGFDALELELRRPDGSRLPACWIGIQNTDDAIRFGEEAGDEPEQFADDPEIEQAVAHDMELIDSWFDDADDADTSWSGEEEGGEFPRFQISVELSEPL